MINKSKKILSLVTLAVGVISVGGNSTELQAQIRDPFAKPGWATPRTANPNPSPSNPSARPAEKVKPVLMPVGAPPVQDRINYFMRLRETAAANNQPLPKPTLVMTIDELSVTGIFRTPRGYAATVQATPINLSYTIYPGDKIFDGQLVAIEENRLVFRKVVKMNNGKFIASEENKTLRQYTEQEVVQGTAPVETSGKTESASNSAPAVQSADQSAKPAVPALIISPLDEMNNQPAETPKSVKGKKGKTNSAATKKPVKVANNKPE